MVEQIDVSGRYPSVTPASVAETGGVEAVTFGVEEEFLLVDPDTHQVTPRANEVMAAVPARFLPYVHRELLTTQVEIATPVCSDLAELRGWLNDLRLVVAQAAEKAGCRLLAVGTGLLDYPGAPPVSSGERYERMAEEYGPLVRIQGLCACHVHVGVADRDLAASVSNHLRPWLPVLQAITVNSPFANGMDTHYGSWRSVMWTRWPTSGPAPWLESAAHHDQIVADLIRSGVMFDNRMVYWYARLSPKYPTVEVRVGDVCLTVDDALLVAALVRGLVATAVSDTRAGRPAPEIPDHLLVAAHWRAAQSGLEGVGFDPLTRREMPAWQLFELLIDKVRPALEERGDVAAVDELAKLTRSRGSGAARQRRVRAAGRSIGAVVDFLAQQTVPGPG